MKENEQNFDELKRLLKLKRHEVPPPGYFNNFSDKVIARIQAGEAANYGTAYENVQTHAPWLARFFAIFEAKPAVIGGFATGLCALLALGAVLTEKSDQTATGFVAENTDSTPMSLASLSMPTGLADAGGIQVSSNSASLQPMATLFGQQNPLLQSASFMGGH